MAAVTAGGAAMERSLAGFLTERAGKSILRPASASYRDRSRRRLLGGRFRASHHIKTRHAPVPRTSEPVRGQHCMPDWR